jgi:site-specific recombinase XerD
MRFSKRRKQAQASGMSSSLTPFERVLEAYLLAHKAQGHSWQTVKDYEQVLRLFFRFLTEERGKQAIEEVELEDYRAWVALLRERVSHRGRAYSSQSVRTYANYVGIFFRWLEQQHYLSENPLARERPPKVEKPLIRIFTEEELRRLDAACERPVRGPALTVDERKALAARDRAILWVLLSTGIRVGELCRLRLKDVDWQQNMLSVLGKGAKGRKVPFGKVARQHLMNYLRFWRGEPEEPDDHVFLSAFGTPIRPGVVRYAFERLKREAGITDKRVSPHTCRHWFAVQCIKRGMPTVVLQRLLGHETLEMVNTYVRLAEQDQRELYQQFSPVDALEMHQPDRRQQLRAWRQARRRVHASRSPDA